MRLALSVLMSIRYLFARGPGRVFSLKRIRGGILGIALSLVPLVLVYQVANGMIQGISERYLETGTYHLQAEQLNTSHRTISPSVIQALSRIDRVTYAASELEGLALLSSHHNSIAVTVRAISPELVQETGFKTYMNVKAGSFSIEDPQSIVVGDEIARTLHLSVGDSLRLVTTQGMASASLIPRLSTFHVSGIVSSGYQELDRLWVFINIDRGRRIMPGQTAREFIGIKVKHPYELPNPLFQESTTNDPVIDRILETLGTNYRVWTWFELQRNQFLNFVTTRNLLLFIMLLIVLVASVNVSSSMIMMVMEKQQEIAILKSIGARPASIAWIFIMAGGVTGALGALIGLSIGALTALKVNEILFGLEWLINGISWLIWKLGSSFSGQNFESIQIFNPAFYLDHIPINIRPGELLLMGGLTTVLSMAASFFPARRAARLRPLQIMRKT